MYPIYLPEKHLYTQKLGHHEHLHTLHGGVGLTMTSLRSQHWIPCLRKLTKGTIRACHGCKRFQAKAAANPLPGNLPVDRTQGCHPFQVIDVDCAGPIKYKKQGKVESKAYSVVCMFPVSCVLLGFSVLTGNPRVHVESNEVYCKKGEARRNLLL